MRSIVSLAVLACLAVAFVVALGVGVAVPARAGAPEDLVAATAEAHPVFLIVTEGGARGTELARRVCAEAATIVPGAAVVELDRGDPANAGVVKRYRLASAPVPLILVVAANGVAAGGAKPSAITAARLARMVPSAGKAAYLKALDEGKATLVVFAGATTPGRLGATGACAAALPLLAGKAATVVVDPSDEREADFVAELAIDRKAPGAVTVVFNAKGQRTATFDAVPTPAAVAEAATKVVEECCPGGRCK